MEHKQTGILQGFWQNMDPNRMPETKSWDRIWGRASLTSLGKIVILLILNIKYER